MIRASRRCFCACVLLLVASAVSLAAAEAPVTPAVSDAVRSAIAKHEVAGAVTIVATEDKVMHLGADGWADIAAERPMRPDTLFWIASTTKPVTATAVLMLQDEGRLSINDPVSKYLPELAGLAAADGSHPPIMLWHLLTHTSGLAEPAPEQYRTSRTLAELIPHFGEKPLSFEPGAKWQYSQSGIHTLARIVEVTSGQSFDQFVQERLFNPLGMKDTRFYPTPGQIARLAKTYKSVGKDSDGKLEETPISFLAGIDLTSHDRYPAGNGGLFSTAPDYARFCQMLLNGGTFDGKLYLKPETVKLMSGVQTVELKTGFTPGNGWGLGCAVVREPQGVTAMLSPGTFGHGGAYGTQAWIDPAKRVIYILMVQRSNFRNADDTEIRRAFQSAAAAAVGKPAP